MNWFLELISNRFLITGLSAWGVAQVLKTVIHYFIYKKVDMSRLFGDGGMPSGHSATVTSIAAMAALSFGLESFEFALAAILAVVVCHDAMGVRLETGKQAVVLNELVKAFNILSDHDVSEDVRLKEFVGHTPVQVLAGITLGILCALAMHFLVFV